MRIVALALVRCVLLSLLLWPTYLQAQSYPINSHLTIAGHINTCSTNPSGGTDAYACALDSHLTALEPKACYGFVADVPSTGPATITFTGLGTRTITKAEGGITTALADNDIRAGMIVHVCWDGSNMQCQNCLGNAAAGTLAASGTPTAGQAAEWVTASTLQGIAVTGTGSYAKATSPVLTTPTIADLTNATHTHTTAAQGGQLTDAALSAPVGVSKGGTNLAAAADDNLMVGNGTTWQTKAVPDCTDTGGNHLNYAIATNAFTCGTSGGAGGGVTTDTVQRAAFYNTTTTVDGAPGLTFAADGTTITSYANRISTTRTASATLDTTDGPIVPCDATAGAVTLTLPDGTTTAQRHLTIVKIDASANACLIAPNATGADTINGVVGAATLSSRWDRYDVDLLNTATAANWAGAYGIAGPLSVAQGGTGVATLTGLVLGTGTSPLSGVSTMAALNTAITDANIFPDSGGVGIPNRTSATASTATTSSTVGQTLRVTGANTFAFGALDLADPDAITNDLPYANLTPPAGTAKLLGRGDTTGDWQELTLGANCTMAGTVMNCTGGAGGGDFSSNTATSVDSEVILFSGTGGKTGKRATGTGLARLAAGVQSAAELSQDVTTSGTNAVTLATKFKTEIHSAVIDAPTTADTNKVQWYFPTAITITRVACSISSGTSATIQLDERAEATPNTAGTNVMTASLVCDTGSEVTTTFTNATIAARVPLNLQITGAVGTPGALRVHVEFTID